MLAREDDAERPENGPDDDLLPRVFTTWRALLGRVGRRVHESLRPSETTRARRHALIRELVPFLAGSTGVLVGPILGVGAASASGGQRAAWLAAVSTLVWAFGRLLLLELALPQRVSRRRVMRPWAWGLVPYVVAVTPSLTLLAWAVSAGLTAWLFIRDGLQQREATRAVAVAWGTQALFAGVAWVIVNGWVAFLAAR